MTSKCQVALIKPPDTRLHWILTRHLEEDSFEARAIILLNHYNNLLERLQMINSYTRTVNLIVLINKWSKLTKVHFTKLYLQTLSNLLVC
jgi:hypothetical protein